MKKPLSIYGAGRGKTTLVGVVLWIEGEKSGGIVETEDLTIKEGKEDGLIAYGGMNLPGECVVVANVRGHLLRRPTSGWLWFEWSVCDRCYYYDERPGHKHSKEWNERGKGYSNSYGLATDSSSAIIQLVHPLTKEQISTKNGGGEKSATLSTGLQVT